MRKILNSTAFFLLALFASLTLGSCSSSTVDDDSGAVFVNLLEEYAWYPEDLYDDLSEDEYNSYIKYSKGNIIYGDYAMDEIYTVGVYHVGRDNYITCEYDDGVVEVYFIQELTSTNLVLRRDDGVNGYSYKYYVRE